MSTRALFRMAAVALAVSGLFLTVGLILHPVRPFSDRIATPGWTIAHLFWWIGGLAGIVGLTGLYLRQREAVGVLGFAGACLAVIGLGLVASAMYFEALIAPGLAARAPALFEGFPTGGEWEGFLGGVLASGALFGVGFLLFGVAMLRARSMPRGAIILAVAGGVPFAVNFLVPRPLAVLAVIALATGLLWLGSTLWTSVDVLDDA
ncbi:MAG TPA: hypothetical protein VMM18_05565 [Gemmatimonadaceae bacterium]|nr:hypothetical protein [Gemmatimonadaceae bacterium]